MRVSKVPVNWDRLVTKQRELAMNDQFELQAEGQNPDGTYLKHKAQLCAHGGMQKWLVNTTGIPTAQLFNG